MKLHTAMAALMAVTLPLVACSTSATRSDATTSDRPLVESAADLVAPGTVNVGDAPVTDRTREVVRIAQTLYTFWNTGDTAYLDRAVDPTFVDNTLPPGRPQGPAGPVAASNTFRAAVPDLTCELADLYITGDTFTARLIFRGHFTGTYDGRTGTGQPIDFGAIDIQHVGDARIDADWHLEDNLTFLQQAGLVAVG
ncbi:ester cyclase [Rhodococcus sp. 05-2256-B2]|uniref:ester cyclase n=1 Tax=unclassified Rhodococcus (in: high G+C Gram-positive bacteria) TaxID=192944 RepID=UPI000B9C24CF|nr:MULTISPECIES: ester cyclase [unclassified Rhodococcus (in: high G+C Gram-positive bacteria)]OZD80317.1 ester cyclase [Rhodococcus sp. 05-2256-B4]OZD87405.1 ester cyclase [Rhodococcus sp. 05-2256-B3]OZD94808.1 ester cyclase [Rhodococcus sp. 05-2256-B2]OZE07939.1 ester cyclase [Rhodococcus sp. 05-2256-B1]